MIDNQKHIRGKNSSVLRKLKQLEEIKDIRKFHEEQLEQSQNNTLKEINKRSVEIEENYKKVQQSLLDIKVISLN